MSTTTEQRPVLVGTANLRYEAVAPWGQLPAGWTFVEAIGTATDSQDRLYVFNRGEHPMIVFDRDGRFLTSWGEGVFRRPHGIHIGPDDTLYLSDDHDHTVRKFTTDGTLLMTLGTSGRPSDTGVQNNDYRTIRHAGPPFNLPTNLALGPKGEMYVTDGYGNARLHKFSADGRLLLSWGEPGAGPGQFHLPHGIAVDREGLVYVADRENSRVQIFDSAGKFLTQWTDVARPCEVFIDPRDDVYIAELGFRVGLFPGVTAPTPNPPGGCVSIFTRDHKLLARWGGGHNPSAPGDFLAPHDIWVDSRGDLYVSEVVVSAKPTDGSSTAGCHTLQKFVRR